MKKIGLVANHVYTVVAYNAASDQVRLRNSWGYNWLYTASLGGQIWRGYYDAEQPPPPARPNNNGYFWMTLANFQKLFGDIAFEQ